MFAERNYSDGLTQSTMRIDCWLSDGTSISGTGFFCKLPLREIGIEATIIVTNKHVIEDSDTGIIYLPIVHSNGQRDIREFEVSQFENRWQLHPDPEVDLCFAGFGDLLNADELNAGEYKLNYHVFDEKFFPELHNRFIYSAVEDVLMIGYPNGIMDEENMMPVVRKGITATGFNLDYEGRSEFLVDIPAISGSSGSPILYYDRVLVDRPGHQSPSFSYAIKLLGVLYGGYDKDDDQFVCKRIKDIEDSDYSFNLNLGVAVKSNRILEFIPQLIDLMKANE
ncbi:trypsin-like peptidase domain-containing protein [Lewinella sp. JB7]|uniref:trypsin-like peptidase domain-containing protein n=1 Tax=Lewinella sp. JB7 TaxID=2962887 RepID=UPI0020C95E1A|nr:trypsin-like peptidase domain-containing protein [Lewinella sp. JB7]MCP9237938.1 hypothetical protein [Lewinella sp. JB7]